MYLSSEHWNLIARCMKTEEGERAQEREREREREHFYRRDSAYPAFNRQQIVTPGKNVTSGHPDPEPSGAEAIISDRHPLWLPY